MRMYLLGALTLLVSVSAFGGLVGFYPLEGNANDLSGSGANATAVTNVSFAAGYEGQAGSFNGTTSLIQIPININPAVMPLMTMGAWVLPSNVSPIRGIISSDNGGFDRNINIDHRGCGSPSCYSAFTGTGVLAGTAATANPANWVFIAATYNATSGDIRLYVDGAAFATTGFPGSGWPYTQIGHNPSFNEWFAGRIDNVFLFNEVLTSSQLAGIRAGGANAILAYATPSDVPEPATFGTVIAALAAAFAYRRVRS